MENRKPSLPKIAIGTRPNTKKESPMPLEQMIGIEVNKLIFLSFSFYRATRLFLLQAYIAAFSAVLEIANKLSQILVNSKLKNVGCALSLQIPNYSDSFFRNLRTCRQLVII